MTAFTATTHKARKPHRCGYCREPIDPGTVYDRHAGTYDDGGIYVACVHPACDMAATLMWDASDTYPEERGIGDDALFGALDWFGADGLRDRMRVAGIGDAEIDRVIRAAGGAA